MEEEFSGPPMTVTNDRSTMDLLYLGDFPLFTQFMIVLIQVVAEVLLGFGLCMWAGLTVPGKFLSIHPDSEENRYRYFTVLFSLCELILLLN